MIRMRKLADVDRVATPKSISLRLCLVQLRGGEGRFIKGRLGEGRLGEGRRRGLISYLVQKGRGER